MVASLLPSVNLTVTVDHRKATSRSSPAYSPLTPTSNRSISPVDMETDSSVTRVSEPTLNPPSAISLPALGARHRRTGSSGSESSYQDDEVDYEWEDASSNPDTQSPPASQEPVIPTTPPVVPVLGGGTDLEDSRPRKRARKEMEPAPTEPRPTTRAKACDPLNERIKEISVEPQFLELLESNDTEESPSATSSPPSTTPSRTSLPPTGPAPKDRKGKWKRLNIFTKSPHAWKEYTTPSTTSSPKKYDLIKRLGFRVECTPPPEPAAERPPLPIQPPTEPRASKLAPASGGRSAAAASSPPKPAHATPTRPLKRKRSYNHPPSPNSPPPVEATTPAAFAKRATRPLKRKRSYNQTSSSNSPPPAEATTPAAFANREWIPNNAYRQKMEQVHTSNPSSSHPSPPHAFSSHVPSSRPPPSHASSSRPPPSHPSSSHSTSFRPASSQTLVKTRDSPPIRPWPQRTERIDVQYQAVETTHWQRDEGYTYGPPPATAHIPPPPPFEPRYTHPHHDHSSFYHPYQLTVPPRFHFEEPEPFPVPLTEWQQYLATRPNHPQYVRVAASYTIAYHDGPPRRNHPYFHQCSNHAQY